jgi:transposase
MARPLLIADPQNATIEELKQVSRIGTNETATRCTAIQMLLERTTNILIMDNASWHKRKTTHWHNWQPMYLPLYSHDLNPI